MINPELFKVDPFASPTPGQSLTDNPKQWAWEQPAQFSDPVEAFERILEGVKDPVTSETLGKLMYLGISVETIVNSIMSKSFAEGMISPDVAELLKGPLVFHIMKMADDMGVTPKIINNFPKEPMSDAMTLDLLREMRPSEYTKLMTKEQGALIEEDIELNKQLETAKAFMSREE